METDPRNADDLPEESVFLKMERGDPINSWIRAGFLLGPLALSAFVMAIFVVMEGGNFGWNMGGMAAAIFFGLGKFVVFVGISDNPKVNWLLFDPWGYGFMVLYMDVMVAFLVAFNLDLFYRIPVAGRQLRKVRENSSTILDANPWMRKWTFLGVVLFVAFPLTGTGAIGGTFLGQLLGLYRRTTMTGIVVGSVLGSLGLAYGAAEIGNNLKDFLKNPVVVVIGILLAIGMILLLSALFRGQWRKTKAPAGSEMRSA